MEYEFTQSVKKDDYVAFVVNHMKYSFLKPVNIILFSVSIGYLIISPFLVTSGERDFTFTFVGFGLIILLIGLMMFAKKNAAKQYEKSGGELKMTYQINDDALVYKVAEGDISKLWYEFYSVMETEDYLYIYVNKQRGMVILKNALNSDALDFVKRKLKENLKPRRIKLQ